MTPHLYVRRRAPARLANLLAATVLIGSSALANAVLPAEIVLGQTYDAGRADLSLIARVQRAYFERLNAAGGLRGRKIRLVSLDDRGDPAQARDNVRKLLEHDRALALFGMPSVATDAAAGLPQMFVHDRAPKASASEPGAVIVGFYPDHKTEATLIGRRIIERTPKPRIAVLLGADPASEQRLAGLRKGLGDDADVRIAMVQSASDQSPMLEASIRSMQASGANMLVVTASPDETLRALKVAQDIGWKPQRIIGSDSAQLLRTRPQAERMTAAGTESIRYFKDAYDPAWSTLKPFQFAEFPRWSNDRGVQAYTRFGRDYLPDVNVKDETVEYAYSTAQLMTQLLAQCRDRLTRENLVRQAQRLVGNDVPLLSPGIRIYTYPGRTTPITQGQFIRFDGTAWTELGEVLDADSD